MTKRIITVTSLKGGAGKTTTALHLAAYFQQDSPTLLVDADPNRSLREWVARGPGLPFQVISEASLAKEAGKYETVIIDTKGRPERDDLDDMIAGSDLIVVPCPPDAQAVATRRGRVPGFTQRSADPHVSALHPECEGLPQGLHAGLHRGSGLR